MSSLPTFLQEALSNIEPGATFSGTLPAITSSSGRRYFAKHGTPQEVEQWMGEAESLKAMKLAAPGLAPEVLEYGVVDRNGNAATAGDADARPYFVSQYLDLGRLTNKSAEELGRRLATGMHQYTSERGFGFDIPTYCGVTRLKNGWFPSWEACYNSMIADLVSQLRKKGRNAELCRRTEEVQEKCVILVQGVFVADELEREKNHTSAARTSGREAGTPAWRSLGMKIRLRLEGRSAGLIFHFCRAGIQAQTRKLESR